MHYWTLIQKMRRQTHILMQTSNRQDEALIRSLRLSFRFYFFWFLLLLCPTRTNNVLSVRFTTNICKSLLSSGLKDYAINVCLYTTSVRQSQGLFSIDPFLGHLAEHMSEFSALDEILYILWMYVHSKNERWRKEREITTVLCYCLVEYSVDETSGFALLLSAPVPHLLSTG